MFEGVPQLPRSGPFSGKSSTSTMSISSTPRQPRARRAYGREAMSSWPASSSRSNAAPARALVGADQPEAWEWYYNVVGDQKCPIVDTWWQTENGGILITPLPGATDLKPGSATRPFFGVKPVLVDNEGNVQEGVADGNLCISDSWPGQMRTVYGDHKRFIETYFSTYKGMYFRAMAAAATRTAITGSPAASMTC
ncbi:AMP-binding protein [Brucella abortus]|nr:AMP-binding protein [Brucella abortus]